MIQSDDIYEDKLSRGNFHGTAVLYANTYTTKRLTNTCEENIRIHVLEKGNAISVCTHAAASRAVSKGSLCYPQLLEAVLEKPSVIYAFGRVCAEGCPCSDDKLPRSRWPSRVINARRLAAVSCKVSPLHRLRKQ